MKYTDAQIKEQLTDFVTDYQQPELMYVIPFCLGYYGYITNQIWRVINELITEGKIVVSRTDEP